MSVYQYTHISLEERIIVEHRIKQGESLRAIARALNRHPSTISREVRRNQTPSTRTTVRVNAPTLVQMDGRRYRGTQYAQDIRSAKEAYAQRLRRFHAQRACYRAVEAQRKVTERCEVTVRVVPKLERIYYRATQDFVHAGLEQRWSPEQIALRAACEGLP